MVSALRFLPSRNMDQIEIQNVLRPIILAASLFGLIPNSVKFSNAKQCYKIIPKSIYLNIFCTVIFLSLNSSFLMYHLSFVYSINNISQKLNLALEVLNFLIVSSTIYTYAYVNRVKYLKIFNMIVSVWNGIPQSPKSRNILWKTYLASNMYLIVIIITVLIQLYLNMYQPDILSKIIVAMTFIIPQVIQFCFLALYTTLVICITAILARITEQCQKKNVSDELTNIRQMEIVYMKVFEIKMDINEVFEGPILACLFQSFHALVSEAYLIYYGVLHRNDTSEFYSLNGGIWIICQMIKMFSLSYSGNLLKVESLKIGEALHYMSTDGQGLRWIMEVQHFSTMLKYQPMDISVFGYFSLNSSLLFNMFASAITYLFIMVQFA